MWLGRLFVGPGAAIFAIFFVVALIEALLARAWLEATFWIVIGLAFLLADNVSARRKA